MGFVGTKAAAQQPAGFRLLLILTTVNFLNYFDRSIFAVVLEQVRVEFGLGDTRLAMLNAGFTLFCAIAGLPLGYLADRVNRPKLLAVGVVVWSLATGASGLVFTFAGLFIARILTGIGEASCSPISYSLIGDLFPAKSRARAQGIFQLGLPIGSIAAYVIVGFVAQHWGWRIPFLLSTLPGVLLAFILWRMPSPVRGAADESQTPAVQVGAIGELFRSPAFIIIVVSGIVYTAAAYAMNTFLVGFFIRRHEVAVATAGAYTAIVLGVTGLVILVPGGTLVDKIGKGKLSRSLLFGGGAVLLGVPMMFIGFTAQNSMMAVICLSVGWMLSFFYTVTVYPAMLVTAGPKLRGTAISSYLLVSTIVGGGGGLMLTGVVSDYFARLAATDRNGFADDAALASGLSASLSLVVPLSLLLTGMLLCAASVAAARRERAFEAQA